MDEIQDLERDAGKRFIWDNSLRLWVFSVSKCKQYQSYMVDTFLFN